MRATARTLPGMIAPGLYASWKDVPTEGWAWPHFSARELSCKCAGRYCQGSYFHQPDFLDALERLRDAAGALWINSGHRCDLHNAAQGGAPLSQHKRIAADISLVGHDPVSLARAAVTAGFTGLGFGRTFLHIDRRARRTAFHYPGGKVAWTQRFGFDPVPAFKASGHLNGA